MTQHTTMNQQSAIDHILDHYENPRHKGTLTPASLTGEAINIGCGDVVRVTVQVSAEGIIDALRWDGAGCTISQAAASAFSEQAQGRPLADVLAMDEDALAALLGRDLLIQRADCVSLALRALQAAAAEG